MQSGTDVAVADGGTGLSSGTSGGVPYFSGTTTIASSGLLTANGVVYGGGAGATPSATAQGGTNTILTASAGAPSFSAAPIVNTSVQIGVASTATGSLILAHASSASLTTIQAGNATEANTYVWPADGGAANQVLTTDGATPTTALSWATVSSGLTRVGGNTTEGTTTTATGDNIIITVSGLSIAVGTPFLVVASIRKSTGAANVADIGFRVNSTIVLSGAGWSTAGNAVDTGTFWVFVGSRGAGTDYLRPMAAIRAAGSNTSGLQTANTADFPNAEITSISILGASGSASITMGVDEVHVYTLATS